MRSSCDHPRKLSASSINGPTGRDAADGRSTRRTRGRRCEIRRSKQLVTAGHMPALRADEEQKGKVMFRQFWVTSSGGRSTWNLPWRCSRPDGHRTSSCSYRPRSDSRHARRCLTCSSDSCGWPVHLLQGFVKRRCRETSHLTSKIDRRSSSALSCDDRLKLPARRVRYHAAAIRLGAKAESRLLGTRPAARAHHFGVRALHGPPSGRPECRLICRVNFPVTCGAFNAQAAPVWGLRRGRRVVAPTRTQRRTEDGLRPP